MQIGEAMSGTCRSNRKARSPIFPVRICTRSELSALRKLLWSLRRSFVGGLSDGSSARCRRLPCDRLSSFRHRSSHSLVIASWTFFWSTSVRSVASHPLAHSVAPLWYSVELGGPHRHPRRCRLCAIAAQLFRMSCPIPDSSSLVSNSSATRPFRYRSSGGI
jgi:hypothetical protein